MAHTLVEPCTVRHAQMGGMQGVVSTLEDGQTYFYEPFAHVLHRLDSTKGLTLGQPVALQIVRDVLRWMRRAKDAQPQA
jgi:hypothetical protein